jgi:hypothetical protein
LLKKAEFWMTCSKDFSCIPEFLLQSAINQQLMPSTS